MDHDVVYKEHALPIARDASQNVTTVLICQNILLSTGISQILAGTRISISEQVGNNLSDLSALPGDRQVLFLICDSRSEGEYSQILKNLKEQCPSARVVVLADGMDPRALLQIYQDGLDGLCMTTMDRQAIVKALELVMLGETFIPGSIGLSLLDQIRNGDALRLRLSIDLTPAITSTLPDSTLPMNKLSEREAQILRCLTHGASNKLIARELGVAEATVKVHVKAILRKVKAANRTQAAMWAAGHFASQQQNEVLISDE